MNHEQRTERVAFIRTWLEKRMANPKIEIDSFKNNWTGAEVFRIDSGDLYRRLSVSRLILREWDASRTEQLLDRAMPAFEELGDNKGIELLHDGRILPDERS